MVLSRHHHHHHHPSEYLVVNYKSKRNKVVNGNLLYVRNFGSPSICESDVKPNDVRVFLLKLEQLDDHDETSYYLSLNSSVVRIETSDFRYSSAVEHQNGNDFNKCKILRISLKFDLFGSG